MTLHRDDDALAAAFAEAARPRAPSRFETARAARDLDAALDLQEQRRRRGWRTQVVAGAVALAAAGGVVLGVLLQPGDATVAAATAPSAPPPVSPAAPLVAPSPVAPVEPPPAALLAPAVAAVQPAPPAPSLQAPVRRSEGGWRAAAEALGAAGDDAGAARIMAGALLTDDSAAAPLMAALRKAPVAAGAVDATLASSARAEAMRVRCELKLLYRRDRTAVDACRAFAQQFPGHPGVRVLSFAAGRVAEDELSDLQAAEAEYGRALLLSPLAGLPATEVLLARARVREGLGELDEARADLRLYLHQEPAAQGDPAVQSLMKRLGVAPRN